MEVFHIPRKKTPDWIGQNHSYTVNGNTVNEMEIQLCGSFGSNDCLYPDTTFLNVDVSTPIIFAVISKTAITIDIRTETQKCANLNCANGLCNENIGCDCTGTDFTGILCEKPLCNSLNKCSNNGDCLINPQNGSNVCRCYSGYIGESCNITSGDTTKVLDLPGFGANSSEMNFTGLSAGPSEFSYQNLSRSDFMTESVIIILKKDPAKPKSDPILSILPQSASEVSISNILMYDKNSWIEYSDIHTMILHCDIFSEGDIRVGVNDGPYSEESVLQYSLSMQVLSGAACPVQLNNCNGQGTCNVNNCPNPICVCNDGYFGYDCSMKYYTFNLLATGATNESISVGGWKFFKVKLQNTISQVVFKLKNYDPMVSVIMLVHTTTFPRLDSLSAQYHFSAMKNRSQDQTVEFFKTSIAAPFKTEYYISIYSMRDNMRDSDFEFSYTTDTTIRSTYRCHEDSDAEQTTPCYCSAQYSGSLCKTPVLNEFSNFLTAAYKIQYLSPNLRETIAYPHKRLLIYKIPQFALGKSEMNVVIEAPSVSNTTLCPTTMLISIRPPRSIYDFTYLSTNTEFNKNSIAISEESVSGKYWIAIISEEQCEYILYTERGPIAYPKASDESFVSGITQWVKENPALIGVVVAIIVIIIVVAAFALYKSHKTESTKQQDMYYTGNSTPANKIISTLDRDSFRLSHTTEKPANLTLNPNIVVCQFCKTQTPRGVRCVTCGRKIINSRNY